MDDKELADKIIELYTKYASVKIVAKKLGISESIVKKYVPKFKRIPIEERKIPLDEIDEDCDSESRAKDIDDLVENIRKNGLLEPIVVEEKVLNASKHRLKSGLRRYYAYVELNKKYPEDGYDVIPAKIVRVNYN